VLNTSDVVILGWSHNAAAIASYRAVLPVARLNQLVMNSFALLYAPLMARLWARGDREGVNRLYWSTAAWVAVMTFPVFALTFGLARPLTIALFGHRYASSAAYLEILAFAYYFNAALGFNGVTLKMLGHVRYVAGIAGAAAVMSISLNLVLIPRYGPMGAAVGTAITLSAYNMLKQFGLRLGSGIRLFELRYLPLYLTIVGGAGSLFLVQYFIPASIMIALPVATVASALVLVVGRRELDIGETFPEVRRIPLLGPWLAGPPVKA
jgi:O-antigen/teichoic acid export membrane protein